MAEDSPEQPPRSRVLGMGDYEHQDSDSRQRAGRRHFLAAVNHTKPEVLQTLCTGVLPLYANLVPGNRAWERLAWEYDEATAAAGMGSLIAVHSWAQDWHLDTPWVKARALSTLARWHTYSDSYGRKDGSYDLDRVVRHGWDPEGSAYSGPLTDEEVSFRLPTLLGYRPDWESRQEAESRIRKVFREQLSAHLDRTEVLMRERGWRKKVETRNIDHFIWAADFQVGCLNYAAVGRKYDAARQTVFEAVESVSQLIDLPLRKSPPGRRGNPPP